ncbi:flagellar basal-body rod protein FlgG [Oharaeibacter diazotrophicus]|uniref:Flagellar basal-body rod protein FlgG n=1 Tax=Oharaeibacter diazotrophicus TaxID=1920512 RepID=A0A4R6RP71_9HYPH|nr:flagellar basal-body rod protein FlgG [Oharaeibacter diazotrophicus]TDP87636.1 flagellar basal-body rod protein FlgG [Oharaeibacter diazotrophicus]BBE74781.1 flagellar basal-body rod protein FlgG [Pleomorphomonas sp. SM30]GLS77163.1 flagellar basal-body rod protein FlgG [Oharaeibacter diazotrophicus]
MKALNIAATGMMAQEMNVNIISNNIANMRTTGYKRQRVDFQDLYNQNLRRQGASTSEAGTIVPAGVQVGSGVRVVATPRIMSQGDIEQTDKDTDVAVRGEGYVQVQMPDGRTGYTRDGSFEIDATGTIVTQDGYSVLPAITVPPNSKDLTISQTGTVQVTVGNATTPTVLGQIQLARFVNKAGLEAIGDNLFVETTSSGAALVGNPGDEGFGTMLQGHLEMANVVPVSELSSLIAAQRAYEMNSRIIRAADEMSQAIANLK